MFYNLIPKAEIIGPIKFRCQQDLPMDTESCYYLEVTLEEFLLTRNGRCVGLAVLKTLVQTIKNYHRTIRTHCPPGHDPEGI